MTSPPVQHERRAAQRFAMLLPVSIRLLETSHQESGCTQDVSARGVFLYTECPVVQGTAVELTLVMPQEITLTESMRVRCRGRVLRVLSPAAERKLGVAVQLEGYEFLPEARSSAEVEGSFGRIASLHEHPFAPEEPAPAAPHSGEPTH
jgi:PilZ domain-containing protein